MNKFGNAYLDDDSLERAIAGFRDLYVDMDNVMLKKSGAIALKMLENYVERNKDNFSQERYKNLKDALNQAGKIFTGCLESTTRH